MSIPAASEERGREWGGSGPYGGARIRMPTSPAPRAESEAGCPVFWIALPVSPAYIGFTYVSRHCFR